MVINSHSIGLNYTRNSVFGGENSYRSAGKVVGDTISLIGIGKVDKIFGESITTQIIVGTGGSEIINHIVHLGIL